ncbi:IclR family transcriptional regulator [Planosporangium mesophilum]|uniref:IclR family transcriptional regulator n=2 Tax=Planosporangium mesophilum TaxID=689768 RepID=A0A8J3TCY2_9ACTN|nr:IclR family transcriptional regulator [Planosporangium mesophilum]
MSPGRLGPEQAEKAGAMSREDPDVIDSVEKAFRLLQAFSAEHPTVTVSEAAQLTGLTRATARRILLTFVRLGFAEAVGREFRLTPHVLRLGYGYLNSQPVAERAQPHMRALADKVLESCSMATLDEGEIVYLARVPAARSMSITLSVGSRLPAYPTSMGRVLLAALPPEQLQAYLDGSELRKLTPHTIDDADALRVELDQVRQQGYAVVDGEREEGVRSAAAPVRDASGAVIAAINVSANAARVSLRSLREEVVPHVVATADAISRDIGFGGTRVVS